MLKYLEETTHKATQSDDKAHLRWLDPHLNGVDLASIDRARLDQIMATRKAEGVANATVNRTLEVVRAVLRKAAYEWEWIDKAPRLRMLPEPKRRIRWITREEAAKLLAELPKHLRAAAEFSLETGLRKSNVTGLEWSQVDLDRRCAWIHPDQAKRDERLLCHSQGEPSKSCASNRKTPTVVFTLRKSPSVRSTPRAWKAAL